MKKSIILIIVILVLVLIIGGILLFTTSSSSNPNEIKSESSTSGSLNKKINSNIPTNLQLENSNSSKTTIGLSTT